MIGGSLRQFRQVVGHDAHDPTVAPEYERLLMLAGGIGGSACGADHGRPAALQVWIPVVLLDHALIPSSVSTGGQWLASKTCQASTAVR